MAIKGLAQAMKNLDAIDRRAVPRASATTLNRVAGAIIAKTASSVARELAVPRRLIRARIRLSPARPDKVYAKVYINTGNLPAIKLGEARVRLSRRKRRKKGQRAALKGGGSVLIVGKRRIPDAFITRLANGRWHVMQRMPWYSAAIFLIPICISFDTAEKRRYATYLILNRRFSVSVNGAPY